MFITFTLFIAIAFPVGVVILEVCRRQFALSWVRVAFLAVFGLYLMMVVKYVVFPIPVDPQMAAVFEGQTTFWEGVNPIPANLLNAEYLMSLQGAGNVILAFPFGFLLPLVWRTTWLQVTGRSALFAVALEGSQLAVSGVLGFTYRTIDVTDLVLNGIGAVGGYLVFFILGRVYESVLSDEDMPSGDVWRYVATAFRRSNIFAEKRGMAG